MYQAVEKDSTQKFKYATVKHILVCSIDLNYLFGVFEKASI